MKLIRCQQDNKKLYLQAWKKCFYLALMWEQSLKKSWSSDSPRGRSARIVEQNPSLVMVNTMANSDTFANHAERASLTLRIQQYTRAGHRWISG